MFVKRTYKKTTTNMYHFATESFLNWQHSSINQMTEVAKDYLRGGWKYFKYSDNVHEIVNTQSATGLTE